MNRTIKTEMKGKKVSEKSGEETKSGNLRKQVSIVPVLDENKRRRNLEKFRKSLRTRIPTKSSEKKKISHQNRKQKNIEVKFHAVFM